MKFNEFIDYVKENKDYYNVIEIKTYHNILDKDFIMRKFMIKYILQDIRYSDAVSVTVETELLFLFYVLLSYTNLEITEKDITFENYDILDGNGIIDDLKHRVGKDYINLTKMIDRCINISNISSIIQTFGDFDSKELKASLEELKRATKDIDVKEINKLLVFNNPALKKLVK